MNDEVRAMVEEAGCPKDVIDTLWFSIFIQKYTYILMTAIEKEVYGEVN